MNEQVRLLQAIVEIRRRILDRAKSANSSGIVAVGCDVIDAAEIDYLNAQLALASAKERTCQ